MQIKSSNNWETGQVYTKVSGVWRDILVPYVKTGGTWRATWSYSWSVSNWSNCSNTCGTGTQTRTVTCKRNDNVIVDDKFCTAYGLNKPVTSQTCTESSGCTYGWYTGSYGSCSTSCGTGTQTRTVYCQRSDGTKVADSYCSGTKPSTSVSCSSTSGCTYSWYSGSWGSKTWISGTVNCGRSSQSRTVYCQRSDGTEVSDSYCSSTGSKPSTTRTSTSCSNCIYTSASASDWDETNYIYAKIEQCKANPPSKCENVAHSDWTYSKMRSILIQNCGSVYNHFKKYGDSEGVCPLKFCDCCSSEGYTYMYPC